jgi:hypothetical protein
MNRLNPELKRLLSWARQAPALPPAEIPLGFSQRIATRWSGWPTRDLTGMWQRAILRSLWPATAVIVVGLAILIVQRFTSNSFYGLSQAYQVVSVELVP